MKTKRLLSALLAAMVVTAAGCSDNSGADATTTTTTAAETEATTTTAAETTTEATTTEAETTPAETEAPADNPLMTEEMRAFIDAVKAEAPVYGDFLEKTSSIPVTMALNQEADLMGTGEITTSYMELGMASFDSFYVSTDTLGTAMDIIITDGKYYMVSPDEKAALYMEMSDEEAASMQESMTASVKANFDASAAKYETGEAEFKNTTYYYEKITTEEMGEIMVYADTATKELKYVVSQGVTMEIVTISDKVDESKFEIPADYTIVDMAAMMGTAGGTDVPVVSGNADEAAASYLAYSSFSYSGLVEQLEFEGYSHEEAVAAADNCGADWDEQAAKSAATYLEYSAFSYTGLIGQLEFEGFTTEQATKAVDNSGADWNEQAVKAAKEYLDYSEFTRDELISQLEFEGFTAEQAAHGADANGL